MCNHSLNAMEVPCTLLLVRHSAYSGLHSMLVVPIVQLGYIFQLACIFDENSLRVFGLWVLEGTPEDVLVYAKSLFVSVCMMGHEGVEQSPDGHVLCASVW